MTQYYDLDEWVDVDVDHVCDDCGHETEVRACGNSSIKVTCYDFDCSCYPSCGILTQVDYMSDSPEWILPDGTEFSYTCPNCESDDIKRRGYNDGGGYVDVKVECRDCGAGTWE